MDGDTPVPRKLALIAFALASVAFQSVLAQEKSPARPIELVVPWGPGGGPDALARKIAPALAKQLKVPLPVLNVPGAIGQTGLEQMLARPADGHTISVFASETLAVQLDPAARWKLEDISPAAIMIRQASAFFIAEASPLRTWKDVEAQATVKPLKVAIAGHGSAGDLIVRYLTAKGLKLQPALIPRTSERHKAILRGEADLLFEPLGDVKDFLENKQMRPMLILARARFPAYGNVPASREFGHTIVIHQFGAVVMRSGTDPARVTALSDALARVAAAEDYRSWLKDRHADERSFIPAAGALSFLWQELDTLRKHSGVK
ncbi:MAG: tripartite tricarboxylate transporter substrate binding protein [Betaproteobacteria bacterium]|nr:tripartite tricarboxylate transporter substrate binding protein [Betaproteobacteria bacterium]